MAATRRTDPATAFGTPQKAPAAKAAPAARAAAPAKAAAATRKAPAAKPAAAPAASAAPAPAPAAAATPAPAVKKAPATRTRAAAKPAPVRPAGPRSASARASIPPAAPAQPAAAPPAPTSWDWPVPPLINRFNATVTEIFDENADGRRVAVIEGSVWPTEGSTITVHEDGAHVRRGKVTRVELTLDPRRPARILVHAKLKQKDL